MCSRASSSHSSSLTSPNYNRLGTSPIGSTKTLGILSYYEIKTYMNKFITSKHLAQKQFEDIVDVGSYYGSECSSRDSSSSMNSISFRGVRGPMDRYMVKTS
ncbi:hypothetical protein M5K25_011469 [Dendrobium thyrsiflorum]|uniref:Uncharacterized protein n=1 Tax=Dendrobium thyrsiflorum TaxID=117978 RepID=A0ABD0VAA1_DENTH